MNEYYSSAGKHQQRRRKIWITAKEKPIVVGVFSGTFYAIVGVSRELSQPQIQVAREHQQLSYQCPISVNFELPISFNLTFYMEIMISTTNIQSFVIGAPWNQNG
jgi:hypothetical protein